MAFRKIELMHRQFGKLDGKQCRECNNLVQHLYDKRYYKCVVYGESKSEATDWRLKYPACGMFNKEWNGNPIKRLVFPCRENEHDEPIAGQIDMMEVQDAETGGVNDAAD